MRLILIGCEYAGKTTLASEIVAWTGNTMGSSRTFHDHFSIPNAELPVEDRVAMSNLSPYLRQLFQLYMINHHFHDNFYNKPDHNLVGFHIEEAIYGPLYYGYAADGDVGSPLARRLDGEIMQKAPDTVLILLRARAQVIAQRMADTPHEWPIVAAKDIELVLRRFEEEYQDSLIPTKFALDTSDVPVQETLTEFARLIEPHLSQADRQRIQEHAESPT
jgi:hypothetical protein